MQALIQLLHVALAHVCIEQASVYHECAHTSIEREYLASVRSSTRLISGAVGEGRSFWAGSVGRPWAADVGRLWAGGVSLECRGACPLHSPSPDALSPQPELLGP